MRFIVVKYNENKKRYITQVYIDCYRAYTIWIASSSRINYRSLLSNYFLLFNSLYNKDVNAQNFTSIYLPFKESTLNFKLNILNFKIK